jgi:hypothetical protein
MFCKHEWEKMSDTIIRAMPEEMLENIAEINGNGSGVFDVKHIVILACKKCGKIYKSVETLE